MYIKNVLCVCLNNENSCLYWSFSTIFTFIMFMRKNVTNFLQMLHLQGRFSHKNIKCDVCRKFLWEKLSCKCNICQKLLPIFLKNIINVNTVEKACSFCEKLFPTSVTFVMFVLKLPYKYHICNFCEKNFLPNATFIRNFVKIKWNK